MHRVWICTLWWRNLRWSRGLAGEDEGFGLGVRGFWIHTRCLVLAGGEDIFLRHIRFLVTSSFTMSLCVGLSSLFPLLPSFLIRQGSVPKIQEFSLSKSSFSPIIVWHVINILYLSYHIKNIKKIPFFSHSNILSLIKVPLAMATRSTVMELIVRMTVTACIDWFWLRGWLIHKGAICTRIAFLWRDTNWDSKSLCPFTKSHSVRKSDLKISLWHSNKQHVRRVLRR